MAEENEASSEPVILREVTGPVAVLTLNRPKARNALDDAMRETLRAELEALSADPDVRVIVLTGAGSAFCAGGDIKGMRQRLEQPPGQVAYPRLAQAAADRRLHRHARQRRPGHDRRGQRPGHGPRPGRRARLRLHHRGTEAQFAASFVKRGLVPDGGGLYTLPRRIGLQLTKELIYSGRTVGAEEALRIHLADRLAEPGRAPRGGTRLRRPVHRRTPGPPSR